MRMSRLRVRMSRLLRVFTQRPPPSRRSGPGTGPACLPWAVSRNSRDSAVVSWVSCSSAVGGVEGAEYLRSSARLFNGSGLVEVDLTLCALTSSQVYLGPQRTNAPKPPRPRLPLRPEGQVVVALPYGDTTVSTLEGFQHRPFALQNFLQNCLHCPSKVQKRILCPFWKQGRNRRYNRFPRRELLAT